MFNVIIQLTVAAITLVSATLYIWRKINNNKIIYFKINNIIKFVICCTSLMINYHFMNKNFKPFISTLIIMLYFTWLYRENIKTSIITPIYSQLIVLTSELIFVLFILVVSPMNEIVFAENYFGTIISNISIAIISCVLINIKFISKIYYVFQNISDYVKTYQLLLFSIFIIIISTLLIAIIYYKVNILVLLIINISIIIIYTCFVFLYLKSQNNYAKVYDKYNMTLNSLKEYEDILSRYRISSHENKNQLLTIRNMIKNKKVTSYIDEIVENKLKDNEKLMAESLIIPEGGLRGLIYSKMLLMKENNIHYDLCIDKKIKTTYLSSLSDDLMMNICNIIGVYLDNAIEEVKKLDEKYIVIEMYMDDTLNIAITNNYVDNIDIDKMDDVGYSTKGNGHGYGLSLVKEIIDSCDNIINEKHISEDEFTQEIKIKM